MVSGINKQVSNIEKILSVFKNVENINLIRYRSCSRLVLTVKNVETSKLNWSYLSLRKLIQDKQKNAENRFQPGEKTMHFCGIYHDLIGNNSNRLFSDHAIILLVGQINVYQSVKILLIDRSSQWLCHFNLKNNNMHIF